MPGEEVQGHIPFPHFRKKKFVPFGDGPYTRVCTGHCGTADEKIGKAALEVLDGNFEEVVELLGRAGPATRINLPLVVVPLEVGLVPDFPVLDIEVEAVGPTFIVVTDDMLAYLRPLFVVLGRIDIVLFQRLVLDALAKTVENLHARILNALYISVGKGKVIRLRLVWILREIRENDGDIHHVLSVGAVAGGIVIAGIAYVGSRKIPGSTVIYLLGIIDTGAVVHGIHPLDRPYGLVGRHDNLSRQDCTCTEQNQTTCNYSFHITVVCLL